MKRLVIIVAALSCALVAVPVLADEIDNAVKIFTADDGRSAAEKLPALRKFIEARQDNPKTLSLVSLMWRYAEEANDDEAGEWAAGVLKKLSRTNKAKTPAAPATPKSDDNVINALRERLSLPPPTDEECQEAFAKLPPLKPLPVPQLEPVKTPIPDAFINSAGRRAAIINVKEMLRVFIGDMDEEDTKAFDEKWNAALDFPCAEVTDWLKKASPIITELVKRKAEAEEASDEYEEALAEFNLLRLNRFWHPAYEAMREMLTVAERVKMLKARLEELCAALEALGPMPDPAEIKKKRQAQRLDAEQAMQEYFGLHSNIGGWYEAVGLMLKGKPAILDAKGKVVEEAGEWRMTEPQKMLYIRPLYKYPSTGLAVVYVNEYNDEIDINAISMVDDGSGGYSAFSSGARTTYTPFRDEDGNEMLSLKILYVNSISGIEAESVLYRRVEGIEGEEVYGHTKDKVLGTVRNFDKFNPEVATNKYDKIGVDMMCQLKSDELKSSIDGFQKNLEKVLGKKNSVADMPFAKDVYYVLTGMEPTKYDGSEPVTNGVKESFCSMNSEPDGWKWYKEQRDKVEPPPMVQERQLDGSLKLVRKRGYSAPSVEEHCESVAQNAMFRCDVKRIEEKYFISNRSGKKMQLDSGTAETHVRWMPPTTVVRAIDNRFKMPFWTDVSVKPTKHMPMAQGVRVECFTHQRVEWNYAYRNCQLEFKEGKHDNVEVEGWIAKCYTNGSQIVSLEILPESHLKFFVTPTAGGSALREMGTMGILYNYKRMVLTEEEAERIAKETVASFTGPLREEWDAKEFESVSRQIDEYVANLKVKEEEAASLGERIAFHEENKRWMQENLRRREEQMKKELEIIQKHEDIILKDADELNEIVADINLAANKIEKERDGWWYELLTEGNTWDQDVAYNEAVQQRQKLEGHYAAVHKKAVVNNLVAADEISEASKRYAQLEFMRIGDISSIQYEDAMIEAEKTGEFHPPFTAFDAMCHMQLLESCQRDIDRDREAKNVRENVRRAIQRLSEQDDAKMRGDLERLAKYGDEKRALSSYEKAVKMYGTLPPANEDSIEEWRAFGRVIAKINSGRAGQQSAQSELDLIDAEQRLHNAKCVKGGCTALLCIGSMGATTPAAAATMHNLMMAHFMVDGFAEKGVAGAAEGFVRCYSGVADFIISGVEGYKSDGWRGVALHIGGSVAFHVGMPFVAKTGILTKDVKNIYRDVRASIKKGAKDGYAKLRALFTPKAAVKGENAELAEYLKFKKEGVEAISEYVARVNDLHNLNELTMTNEQIQKAREAVVKAAAIVNQHPDAKIILKNDPAYRKIAERFDEDVGRIYKATVSLFHRKMADEGFSLHAIKQFRNDASKGTIGMDADYGMVNEKFYYYNAKGKRVEVKVPITYKGKRSNLVQWRDKGEPKLHEAYKEATFGVGDGEKAWVNLTTSKYAEAYHCGDVLTKTGTDAGVREILDKISLSDMQQTMDVTRFKAFEILNQKDFPRLARVVEVCRGTAKDLNTKVLRMIDVRIKDLQALKIKKGSAFTPAQEVQLQRLTEARKYYGNMADIYTKIGNHTIPPHQIDDAVREATGKLGILESLERMSILMQSLVLIK